MMSAALPLPPTSSPDAPRRGSLPRASGPWLLLALGTLILYGPSVWDLFHGIWATSEQAHGPIILGISAWLIWRRREAIAATPYKPVSIVAWPLIALALAVFALGRSQGILIFEVGSMIPLFAGFLLLHGVQALKAGGFGLFFLFFMIPLPAPLVDTLTQPMRLAVSFGTEQLLYALGYPISRSGVILQMAQYQLQVADVCAGLHTLFSLEALGLVYLNVVRHASVLRNVVLAVLIVPISFAANVIRVTILTLVTYYWGDAAGQGFLHDFAGYVLYLAALLLIMLTDSLLRLGVRKKKGGVQGDAPAGERAAGVAR
jgi:exosortase B